MWTGICIFSVVYATERDISCGTTGAGTAAGVDDALTVVFRVVRRLFRAEGHCVGCVNMIRVMHLEVAVQTIAHCKHPAVRCVRGQDMRRHHLPHE